MNHADLRERAAPVRDDVLRPRSSIPSCATITYANAGHNFPYLYRVGDGKGEFGSLMIRGNRLGDDATSKYEAKTTELVAGDVIVWYTDGIVECENAAGEEYGEKKFRASVRRAAALDAARRDARRDRGRCNDRLLRGDRSQGRHHDDDREDPLSRLAWATCAAIAAAVAGGLGASSVAIADDRG